VKYEIPFDLRVKLHMLPVLRENLRLMSVQAEYSCTLCFRENRSTFQGRRQNFHAILGLEVKLGSWVSRHILHIRYALHITYIYILNGLRVNFPAYFGLSTM
jgi:hypothetical protein